MFTCGPSIYQRPHIGNYRSFIYEDVLHRYLEYLGYAVERLINFTDVEDKAVSRAGREGKTLAELTEPVARKFMEECALLRIKLPCVIPRSSTTVDQAVRLIRILLDKGYAYWYEGDVFYDPLTFKGFGKLYGLDMSKWPEKRIRYRKDTYAGNRWNRGDFILWHGCGDGDVFCWHTEIGPGRPAWSIQDAAMITRHLGYSLDISCGGVDNLYRHHDYTIAIIEAVTGSPFSRYWLHGEHVLKNGRKMSKSKGNILYLEDLSGQGHTPVQVRFYLLYGHYRRRLNLTDKSFRRAAARIDRLRKTALYLTSPVADDRGSTIAAEKAVRELAAGFEKAMNDDLNVKAAVDHIDNSLAQLQRLRSRNLFGSRNCASLRENLGAIDGVLQVLL